METVIESVRAWPEWVWVLIGVPAAVVYIYVGCLCVEAHNRRENKEWGCEVNPVPIVSILWPLYLASYPLRRLGRWWREKQPDIAEPVDFDPARATVQTMVNCAVQLARSPHPHVCASFIAHHRTWLRNASKNAEIAEAAEAFVRGGDDAEGAYETLAALFDAPEQPGKRGEENTGGETEYVMARLDAEAACLDKLTPGWRDKTPPVPYGSRVPEDAKPVTREQRMVDVEKTRIVWADVEKRLAALEVARAGEGVPFFEQQLDECKITIGQDGSVVITGWKKQERAQGLVRWRDGKPKDGWYDQDAERRASP